MLVSLSFLNTYTLFHIFVSNSPQQTVRSLRAGSPAWLAVIHVGADVHTAVHRQAGT